MFSSNQSSLFLPLNFVSSVSVRRPCHRENTSSILLRFLFASYCPLVYRSRILHKLAISSLAASLLMRYVVTYVRIGKSTLSNRAPSVVRRVRSFHLVPRDGRWRNHFKRHHRNTLHQVIFRKRLPLNLMNSLDPLLCYLFTI